MDSHWFYPPRNFGALAGDDASYDRARVLVLPVPYDSTVTYKTGAREGPQAILDASGNIETFDHELVRDVAQLGIHTLPEVAPVMESPHAMVERLYAIAKGLAARGALVAMLGGEHLLAYPMAKAFAELYSDLTVLYFDAHGDLRDSYLESRYTHACTARRIVELCPITQVGIRSVSQEEWDFLQTKPPITTFFAEQSPLREEALEQLLDSLGPNVYISFDLDALDPSIMQGVGNPEPGGLSWQESTRILKRVAQKSKIVGFDLVELCPPEGTTADAATAAKLAYKIIGYATQQWGNE